MAGLLHDISGTFCPSFWLCGCLQILSENFRHVWQLVTSSWIWSYSPDQYMVCLALCKHFDIPHWPAWSWLNTAWLWFTGIMILFPFSMSPSSVVISLWKFKQGYISSGIFGSSLAIMLLSQCVWVNTDHHLVQWVHKGVASCLQLFEATGYSLHLYNRKLDLII